MNKILKYILTITMLFSVFCISDVYANQDSYLPSCINEKKCLEICSYSNKINDKEPTYYIYIVYNYKNKSMQAQWVDRFEKVGYNTNKYDSTKYGMSSLHKIRGHGKKPFIQAESYEKLIYNGICPANGYVDSEGKDKACFDDNSSYCTVDDPGGAFDTFEGSTKLEYTLEQQLTNYFQRNVFFEMNYKEYANASEKDFENSVTTAFEKNFLSGNKMPSFIQKNSAWKNGIKNANLERARDEFKRQVDADKTLSDKEKDDYKSKIDSNYSKSQSGFNKAIDDMSIEVADNSSFKSCQDILGANVYKILQKFFKMIYVIIPFLVLVLGMLDLGKAVLSSKEDEMRQAKKRFTKRIAMGLLVFIVPTIINILFYVVNFAKDPSDSNNFFNYVRGDICIDD